jgi:peptidoglycan/LPS O-acetylase OafA/YrhL
MRSSSSAIAVPRAEGIPRRWSYVPELDGLRALSVAAIVAFHDLIFRPSGGYLAVPLFFAISGYLITGLLASEHAFTGGVELRAFYTRRALRLLPALVVAVLGIIVLATLVGHPESTNMQLFAGGGAALFYFSDFYAATGHMSYWFGPTWSLSVEEQFYLFWPLLLILALRALPMRTLGLWCLAGGALAGLLDLLLASRIGFYWTYFSPIGSVMPLLLGCGMALRRVRVNALVGALAGATLTVLVFVAPASQTAAMWHGYQQLAALTSVLVIGYVARAGFAPLRTAPMLWVGRRSYAIYLFHLAIYQAVVITLPAATVKVHTMIAVPITLALAALSFRYVEQPFLRRKTRFARVPGEVETDRALAEQSRGGEAKLATLTARG